MSVSKTLDTCFNLIKEDKLHEAIEYCNRALEIYYNQADIISARGEAFFKLGNKNKAMQNFNEAVTLEPLNPYRYSARAYVKDSMGDLNGAITDYKKAIELDPEDAVAMNNLGLLEEKLGYGDSAYANYRKADFIMNQFSEIPPTQPGKNEKTPQTKTEPPGYWDTISKIFTDRKSLNEFLRFLKNGLRLK